MNRNNDEFAKKKSVSNGPDNNSSLLEGTRSIRRFKKVKISQELLSRFKNQSDSTSYAQIPVDKYLKNDLISESQIFTRIFSK